jgi:hypothetical protein
VNDVTDKIVQLECKSALKKVGFKCTGLTAHYKIDDIFYGWVGLNIARHPSYIRINPNIGIHCAPVMKLFDEMRKRKYAAGKIATYSVPLGFLYPNENQFLIESSVDLHREINRLVSYISYAKSNFINNLADLDTLEEKLKENTKNFGGNPEKYSILLMLRKNFPELESFLEFHSSNLKKYNDRDLANQWMEFAEKINESLLISRPILENK